MTREEIRRLVGGYATGSLTEAERKLLFDAALEDQDLFEELSREQSLKELLELPGARSRLIAALESDEPQPVKSWWAWVAAFAMSVIAVVGVYQLRHQPEVKEVATVQRPANPEIAEPTAVPAPQVPDAPTEAPKAPAPVATRQRARAEEPVASPTPATAVQNAPGPPPATPPPPPPAKPALAAAEKDVRDAKEEALKKSEAAQAQDAISRLDQGQSQAAQQGQVQSLAQDVTPAPQAAAPVARGGGGGGGRGGRGAAGGGRGGGGPAGGAFRANAVVGALGRFAVDYSITPEGLRIVPASAGYLSVGANTNPTIFPTRLVPAGTAMIIPIPADASTLSIGFSATSTAPAVPAARREEASGTLVDQNPPNQQILVIIPAK